MTKLALASAGDRREQRDRLEILEALIESPSFDPIFRPDIICIPKDYPVVGWGLPDPRL